MFRPFVAIALCFPFMLWLPAWVTAARPASQPMELEQAASLVQEALTAEAAGHLDLRKELLAKAATESDFVFAKWQSGQVMNEKGDWQSVSESVEAANRDKTLAEYRDRRARLANSGPHHLAIAQWCAKNGLGSEARAHLHRVIDFDENNAIARNALGYQRMGSEWFSPADIAEIAYRSRQFEQSMRTHRQSLAKIKLGMMSKKERIRNKSLAALMAITDESAVPAVEVVFNDAGEEISSAVVDWLANIDSVEASKCLSRYSLMHPSDHIRRCAASKLKDRPFYDFVPELLQALESPVKTMIVPSFDRAGRLSGYRQAFQKENFSDQDVLFVDRVIEYQPVKNRGGALDGAIARALEARIAAETQMKAMNEVRQRTAAMQRENLERAQRTKRIAFVVATISDEQYTESVEKIWKWWDQYNETEYQAIKPERYAYVQRRAVVPGGVVGAPRISDQTEVPTSDGSDPQEPNGLTGLTERQRSLVERYRDSGQTSFSTQEIAELRSAFPSPPNSVLCECFAAATGVMTNAGLRPIETIVAGDQVLSRNIATGELGWKPVLLATERPASDTMTISLGSESFTCTNGHLFWVSGRGWTRASRLKKNDVLHAAEEPARVTEVVKNEPLPTFNLQIADNANYFVGSKMILSHDVTARGPNRYRVPGLLHVTDTGKE